MDGVIPNIGIDIPETYLVKSRCAVIFTGLQAGGKTTFYHNFFAATHAHINLDTLHTRKRERAMLDSCISCGVSFAVDNTNPTRQDRSRYISPAKAAGYIIVGFYFEPDIAKCAKRNEMRDPTINVPYAALVSTANKLEPPQIDEGYEELFSVRIGNNGFIIEIYP